MSFGTQNPFTGNPRRRYEYASEKSVLRAIDRLSIGFLSWKELKPKDRQKKLFVVADRLQSKKEAFAEIITLEMGKPLKESLAEIEKCRATIVRACSSNLDFLNPRVVTGSLVSVVTHEPVGVIYSIMPWNYPFWQVIRMAIPALLAGNTILLKHSEITPVSAMAIQEIFEGVFDFPVLLNEFIRHDMTDFVLVNSKVGGVSLTGSVNAGRNVYANAARYFKKAVLELGGSDPYIVCDDADLNSSAQKLAKGRLLNCGQSCISVKRILVHKKVLEAFLKLLIAEVESYSFGDPIESTAELGPLAHTRFKDSLSLQVQSLKENTTAKLIYSKSHNQSPESAFFDVQIYLVESNSRWLANQEFFGPIFLVFPFESENEAIQIANATDFGLAGGVFSKDLKRAKKIAGAIEAGQVAVNEVIISDLSLPFGGTKNSGLGRELGDESYFEFTQTKVVSSL